MWREKGPLISVEYNTIYLVSLKIIQAIIILFMDIHRYVV